MTLLLVLLGLQVPEGGGAGVPGEAHHGEDQGPDHGRQLLRPPERVPARPAGRRHLQVLPARSLLPAALPTPGHPTAAV